MNIYLDHNATTPLDPEVLEAMLPYFREKFGNPSSAYATGREAKRAVEAARESTARALGAGSIESVYFTGSGTEADNLAILGTARALRHRGRHIVTSSVEHHAVLHTAKFLEEDGYQVTYVRPDRYGVVHEEAVAEAMRPDTILISIMHANNETGAINPASEIAKIARERDVLFHTDAVQSFCKLPFTVDSLGVDLLSLSGHKIYGPKGVGALYIRQGVPVKPMIHGGHQERNFRAGTENVAGIVGFAKAAELCRSRLADESRREAELRDRLESGLRKRIPHAHLNGHPGQRLSNTLNMSFEFVEAEALILDLDQQGVSVSSGSACTSGSQEPSHVLLAMGIPHEVCRGSLRFSLGRGTTEEEIDHVLDILPGIVERIRSMSPLYTA